MIRSRLAPTPSGYLHLGNAVNFAITAALTRALGGQLSLRIDDLDAGRVRPAYIEDIFATLEWLNIAWDLGPRNTAEVARHSQTQRAGRYIRLIDALINAGKVYACTCSRRDIAARTRSLVYDGHCRHAGQAMNAGAVLRFMLPAAPVEVHDVLRGRLTIDLPTVTGDPVIRRRDGLPAYHVASLADDLDMQVNLVVRGEDLLASTATQLVLAQALGDGGREFLATKCLHHGLIAAERGEKLSKSQGDAPLRPRRDAGESPGAVYRQASALLQVEPAENLAGLVAAVTEIAARLRQS